MASAGGRSSAALAGSQVIGATLPLEGRSRERGFSGGGDLGEVGNLKGGGGGRLLAVAVAGQRRDEGVMGGGIGEINAGGQRLLLIEVAGGVVAMGRDLLDRSGVVDLGGLGERERSSSEAGMADPAPAEERNDLLELGDGCIGGGAAVGGEIESGIGIGIGGLNRRQGVVLLVGIGEQSDELLDAFEAGGGFLNGVGFHVVGGGEWMGVGQELHGHIYRPIKHLGLRKKKGQKR